LLSPGCEAFDATFTSRGLARAVFLFEVEHPSSIERIGHDADARTPIGAALTSWLAPKASGPQMRGQEWPQPCARADAPRGRNREAVQR
jgi:hypothetical protein